MEQNYSQLFLDLKSLKEQILSADDIDTFKGIFDDLEKIASEFKSSSSNLREHHKLVYASILMGAISSKCEELASNISNIISEMEDDAVDQDILVDEIRSLAETL